jgi:hypothetical protein
MAEQQTHNLLVAGSNPASLTVRDGSPMAEATALNAGKRRFDSFPSHCRNAVAEKT